jgi:hypothetical protein
MTMLASIFFSCLLYWCLNQEVEGLKTAEGLNFVRSTDTGKYDEEAGAYTKIISQSRTSHTAWCTEACQKNKMVQSIQKKISEVVNIPVSNWESLQVLQVEFAAASLVKSSTESRDIFKPGQFSLNLFLWNRPFSDDPENIV